VSSKIEIFISEDPIRLAGGINQYVYVGNQPINFTDPRGWDRYAICDGQGSTMKPLCKKTVDTACGSSQQAEAYCCDVDRTSCLCALDANDPQYDKKAKKCFDDYSNCMGGIK